MARRSKKQKLADQCLAYLQQTISDNTTIVTNAEENFQAYRRDFYGNEIEGRSQFVASDVADTIEWIMPYLIKLFLGGSQVVDILPTGGEEDEQKAKLMSAKVNYDFMQRQPGFVILHDWIKAALYQKISAVKYCWERETIRNSKAYEGLDEMELEAILTTTIGIDEDTIEIEENEDGGYNVSFVVEDKIEYPLTEVVPPEEFFNTIKNKTSIAESDFAAHKRRVHRNYLKSKYNVSDRDLEMVATDFEDGTSIEETRFDDLGGINFITDDVDSDFYYIYECYINDYDKNGDKVPMVVTIFGNKVIKEEENSYGRPPFCTLSSIRIPHRLAGMSVADLMVDLQKLHTMLVRSVVDNVAYQNNGVNVVNPYRVSLDDVLNRKEPGATWRTLDDVDPQSAIFPVPSNPLAPQTMQMFDIVEQMREKRSGVSAATSGLNPDTLNNNKSGAVGSLMTAAMQKIELIARIMAETGITDLFNQYVKMNIDYLSQEQAVKVDEKWATISPNQIQGTYDVIVDVGQGTAAKEVQINQWIVMLQTAIPLAAQAGVVNGEDWYNLMSEIFALMGYKNTDKFCTNPDQDPAMAQIHQQYEQQIQQLSQALQAMQVELQKAQLDKEVDMRKLELQDKELMIKALDTELDALLKEKAIELKHDIDVEKNSRDIAKGRLNGGQG